MCYGALRSPLSVKGKIHEVNPLGAFVVGQVAIFYHD